MLDFVFVAMRAGDRARLFIHSLQSTAHPIFCDWKVGYSQCRTRLLIRNSSLLRISTFCRRNQRSVHR